MRILVIEDDTAIAAILHDGLAERGYEVEVASNGTAGLEQALSRSYHLLILDLMLPGMDGYSICRHLRQSGDRTPILMLTARDTVDERVEGLGAGADDYLPKPFDFRELLARAQALLRRDGALDGRTLTIRDLEVNTARRAVARRGQKLDLTRREYLLLETLAVHAGTVVPWDTLQARVEADEGAGDGVGTIQTLRAKVDASGVSLIHPAGTVGYVLCAPADLPHAAREVQP